jgi:hypothetical protein
MSKHPLSDAKEWNFSQHNVQVRAPIYVVPIKKQPGVRCGKKIVSGLDSCREGVISHVRHGIAKATGTLGADTVRTWSRVWTQHSTVDLDRPMLRQPSESYVAVNRGHITYNRWVKNPHYKPPGKRSRTRVPRWSSRYQNQVDKMIRHDNFIPLTNDMVRDYLDVCDAIVGPIGVLMSPDRYQGDWWKTSVQECKRSGSDGMLRWYGVDNTVIAHPALTSLYSGLVRQCAFIVRAGMADRVRTIAAKLPLEKCLTESDNELALEIVKKMRHWIAVPGLKGGSVANVPVGVGTLNKVISLHQAIYEHGFETTFGCNFIKGWAAGAIYNYGHAGPQAGHRFSGIHTFMGRRGENARGKRIKELAKATA